MWIFTKNGFASVVAERGGERLLVRSRWREDLGALFPGEPVIESPNADYPFRVWTTREQLASVVALQIAALRYPNFKSTITENDRHNTYMKVWSALRAGEKPRPPRVWPETSRRAEPVASFDADQTSSFFADDELPDFFGTEAAMGEEPEVEVVGYGQGGEYARGWELLYEDLISEAGDDLARMSLSSIARAVKVDPSRVSRWASRSDDFPMDRTPGAILKWLQGDAVAFYPSILCRVAELEIEAENFERRHESKEA